MVVVTGNTPNMPLASASRCGKADLMNRDKPISRACSRDVTQSVPSVPRVRATRGDSPWCERDYHPTPGERRLLTWLSQVTQLPGKATFRMAVLVLQSATTHGRKRHLRVTPKGVASAGMSRVAAYEGLRALELAGLVTVKRCRGRSPLVTIVDQPSTQQ